MSNWKGKVGPLLIAEIGGNHEGNFDYALKLTELACASGADYVKFQIYTGDTLVSRMESAVRNEHFKKFELKPEQHIQLAKACAAAGVGYMASVWDMDALDWIDPYMSIYKIGSGDLTAYPVLKKTASKNKPIIVSTGLSTLDEVKGCVEELQGYNPLYKKAENLALLQCTSMYPIPKEDANLQVMQSLREATGMTVGYSDHTEGSMALETAVAMGAEILEFHFTDTREGKVFRDHKVSLTQEEVRALQTKIVDLDKLKGNGVKAPLTIEGDHRVSFRRAVYPIMDIAAGTVIEAQHLTTLRPNHGIDARDFDKLIGKTTKQHIKTHQKLDWSLFD